MNLSEEIIEGIRTLWTEGHSVNEIGRRLGISKNTVVGRRGRMGLPARGPAIEARPAEKYPQIDEMLRIGMPVSHIARAVHVGPDCVVERRNALGIPVWKGTTNRGRGKAAWNAKPPPSQAMHDRVVKLLSEGTSNVTTAACVGLSVDEVRKIRKTIVIQKRAAAEAKPREYSDRDIEFLKRSKRHQAGYIAAQASGFGERFQFGKQTERRKPVGKFPTQDEIAAHIAARGVTMCPTAAAAATSGAIAAKDRVVLAEYRNAREAEWDLRNAPRNKRAADGRQHAAAMRS